MSRDVKATIKSVAQKNNLKIDFNKTDLTLKDLGIDSLALLNLIFKVETELGVQIDDATLSQIKNLGDLITAFETTVNKSSK